MSPPQGAGPLMTAELTIDRRHLRALRLAGVALLAGVLALPCYPPARAAGRDTSAWRQLRHALFGQGRDWLLLEVHSHQVRRLHLPPGIEPTSMATTPDGQWLVFTALALEEGHTLLFKWNGQAGSAPVSIGAKQGFHAEVTVSLDGRKAFFSHHPLAGGGPPGQHAAKANAQLYEVSLDGSGLRALTARRGCHVSPAAPAGNTLFFVYTPCDGTRFLSALDLNSRAVAQVAEWGYVGETHLAPDGQSLLIASRTLESLTVYEVEVRTRQAAARLSYTHDSLSSRPQYGATRQQLLYQNEGAIWLFESGTSRRLASLLGEG
jgi:hypothetical protein